MADGTQTTGQDGAQATAQGAEQNGGGQQQEPDYKALYEQAKANSRKWETRAKSNKEAAEELAKLQGNGGKSVEQQIAELKAKLDEKEKAEQRASIAAKVAREKGVPVDLLNGETEEEMGAWADKMLAHFKTKPAPKVSDPGSFDKGTGGNDELREFARKLTGNN
ncbi:hypothetical protein [Adlercreutzia sp. ZJ141]|uniref:hypothetical protein n=1 Tax=Adlercreutzia sp. ZJ141 TaxID=2709406 RepID=UPI0013EAF515|nr:hypothetical protein [Adlercreutzia sp. ZJ141]